jgi:hypothetical protein
MGSDQQRITPQERHAASHPWHDSDAARKAKRHQSGGDHAPA